MNETQRAMFDDLVRILFKARWPSGRRLTSWEHGQLLGFLALWRSGGLW